MIRVVLREILREQGVSGQALAVRAGLARNTVRGLLDGTSTRIDLSTLDAIMRALGVTRVGAILQWSTGDQVAPDRPRRIRRKALPDLPPCGHKRPSDTCYDCLYPPGSDDGEQPPTSYRSAGGYED